MNFKTGDFCTADGTQGRILSVDDDVVTMQVYRDFIPTDEKKKVAISQLVFLEERKPSALVGKSNFKFEVKSVSSDDSFGYFEGYAAVFNNVDSDSDIIQHGAFTETLSSGRKVKLCWQHSFYDVIGGFSEMREDSYGLFVKGRINFGVAKGVEAYSLLKAGDLDSMSIGYSCEDREYRDGVRVLKKLKLYEVSLVTEPANGAAIITSVKFDKINSLGAIENLLATKGFTISDAKALISRVKELSIKRDVIDTQPIEDSSVDAGEDMALLAAFMQLKTITSNLRNVENG